MVLHSATHLFHDGDLAGGLRDLSDIDGLLRHYGATEEGFWERLVPRAVDLSLQRPLFYALRYSGRVFETPIPESTTLEARRGRPSAGVLRIMDALVRKALVQAPDDTRSGRAAGAARWALYVRSHWLRMPTHLLAIHLSRKAWRRWFEPTDQGDR
jgi:hypothetical protein